MRPEQENGLYRGHGCHRPPLLVKLMCFHYAGIDMRLSGILPGVWYPLGAQRGMLQVGRMGWDRQELLVGNI